MIFVTGGTGFVGTHVVHNLVEHGYRVRCLVRPASDRSRLPESVELAEGHLMNFESLQRGVEGCWGVMHVGGVVSVRRQQDFYRINRDGTANLVKAAREAGVERFVLVSSQSAGGPSTPERRRTVDDPPAPITHYGMSKLAGEQVLISGAGRPDLPKGSADLSQHDNPKAHDEEPPLTPPLLRRGGKEGSHLLGKGGKEGSHLLGKGGKESSPLPRRGGSESMWHSIVRPPAVYGPGDAAFFMLIRWLRYGFKLRLGDGAMPYAIIHAEDLAEALRLALEADVPSGAVWYATDSADHNLEEFTAYLEEALGRRGRWLSIPVPLARAIAGVNDHIAKLRGGYAYFGYQKLLDLTQPAWTCDDAPFRQATGFTNKYNLHDGILQTVQWYRDEGWIKN